jgi:rhamnosyl/mannosyltransferase
METHVRTLARAQARLGAEVTVVCVNHLDTAGRDVTWRKLARTLTAEEWDGPVRILRVGRRASLARLDFCFALPGVLRRLEAAGMDVLHLHVPNPTMLLALAAARSRLPLAVTYHSDVVKQKWLRLLLRPFEHVAFRRAWAILASSPVYAAGSELLLAYGPKVVVLPFGIDLAPYLRPSPLAKAHARDLKAAHGQPLWLAVGRLVYYKGLHNAIRALASVPGKLLIVGDGPLEADLRQLAQAIGVAGRVIWRCRLSQAELAGAYLAATALWFPSNARSEAFGLVQVEAMACGCPVLNTAIPHSGVPWVSRHEESGLTVSVDNPEALARAANRLLREPGLRERLSGNARARARQDFADDVMARRTLEIYRRALASGEVAEEGPMAIGDVPDAVRPHPVIQET